MPTRRTTYLFTGLVTFVVYALILSAVYHNGSTQKEALVERYKEEINKLESKLSQVERFEEGRRLLEQRNSDLLREALVKTEEEMLDIKEKHRKEKEAIERTLKEQEDVKRSLTEQVEDSIKKHNSELHKLRSKIDNLKQWSANNSAFVTLVTNNFWKQGVVLIQSARDHWVTQKFVVMVVDPDGLPPGHPNFTKLPAEAEAVFTRLNAEVRYIEQVPVPAHAQFGNPRWAIAWNKLRAYEFTEFDKLVFLDSDMMVMQDITEMTSFADFSAAPGHDIPCELHHGVSGGAFVFSPNVTIFNELMAFAQTDPGDHWYQAEQELLAFFYPTFYKHRLHLISGLYNTSMRSCKCLTEIVLRDHVKIIHFYSGNKPWDHTREEWVKLKEAGTLEHPCIADMCIKWYDLLAKGLKA